MKVLLIFCLSCAAVATALVPRIKRETYEPLRSPDGQIYCAPITSCAWSIYKPIYKTVEMHIVNNYCICAPGLDCQIYEDDTAASVFVFRCMIPAS